MNLSFKNRIITISASKCAIFYQFINCIDNNYIFVQNDLDCDIKGVIGYDNDWKKNKN